MREKGEGNRDQLTVAEINGVVALKTEETVTSDGFVSGPGNGQIEHLIELKLLEQLDIVVDHAVPKP